MSSFLGITAYEYRMGVRRWGLWLACFLAAVPSLDYPHITTDAAGNPLSMWELGASIAIMLNLLLPVVGGIAMADRMERDFRLGVNELQLATPLSRPVYILSKYIGAVLSVCTPVLVVLLIVDALLIVSRGVSPTLLATSLVAFLAIDVVSYLFVGAFAVACPIVMPVRVFQALFTGYWFWGNFVSPDVIPTLSDTLLTPSGKWPAAGFFGMAWYGGMTATAIDAIANLALLAGCAALALIALDRVLARRVA